MMTDDGMFLAGENKTAAWEVNSQIDDNGGKC